VAGTGTGAKKYVVNLCAGERERLEAIIKSGKRDIADHLVPESIAPSGVTFSATFAVHAVAISP
jgi:hypothetical protein